MLIERLKNGTSDLETERILRLIRKYGDENDAEYAKPYLNTDKPDIVRASIKVLEKLSAEYLCIYLPQLMQHKNSKIQITAVRAFQTIDKESVLSMVRSLIKSLNVNQRTLGITTAMMVDFEKIKEDLFSAFMKETNEEILEKLGLVFAANPYRELVSDLYFYHKSSKTLLKRQREKIVDLISEKVSLFLGGNPNAKELVVEAEKAFEEKKVNNSVVLNTTEEVEQETTSKKVGISNIKNLPKDCNKIRESSNVKAINSNQNSSKKSAWQNLNLKAKLQETTL